MNHTETGLIAVGSPNSPMRMIGEIENALDKDLHLLLLTEEGRDAAARFAKSEGCDWKEMTDESKAWLLNNEHAWKFFAGVLYGLKYRS